MNIVFWIFVIIILVLVWFCMSFAFKRIGGIGLRLYNEAKKEMSQNDAEKKIDEQKGDLDER